MPDWSYQTLFKPVLFRLPSRIARGFTLRAMGRISRIPGGTFLIKTLGHMEPSPLLERRVANVPVPTPLGLSGDADPDGVAHRALAQFGFGFMEIGPITVRPIECRSPIVNETKTETIVYPCEYENPGLVRTLPRLESPGHSLPLFARIAPEPGASPDRALEQLILLVETLSLTRTAGFYVDVLSSAREEDDRELLVRFTDWLRQSPRKEAKPFFLRVPLDYPEDRLRRILPAAERSVWSGCVIGNGRREADGSIRVGAGGKQDALAKIALLRGGLAPSHWTLHASAGVHEPQDALELMRAGADYLLLNSGLVYAGPGLPKRINDAVIADKLAEEPPAAAPSFWKHWGWMCLLGIGMMLGGAIAWLIAESSVVLPYDEAFLGMTRDELRLINENLLYFMSHDRITLAGTMISIGILYYRLAKYGMRAGMHWARTAVLVSGAVGFPSFFLYLGYGFFDPLHAAAAAVLLPMFLLAMRGNPDRPQRGPVNLRNGKTWRLAMWGQLCFVALGVALSVGGLVIAGVGVTNVFVPQDLAFLGATPEQLELANQNLIPLIAHDRAGFGGALFSDAVMLTVVALWGIQQGQRWLWWTLLAGGAPAFIAGISVHFHIGYTDFVHLLPAYFAVALYVAGLVLLYPYLMREESTRSAAAAEKNMTVL
ncbi:hypothetical protein ACF3MZ_22335 [Paenibacillaceae bacterium WGS1546]|uniref:hypothetical protein n=1 Tax=Cohnella sp. WGS1546 TaxID=3366810 RepID=UPI00372D3CEE